MTHRELLDIRLDTLTKNGLLSVGMANKFLQFDTKMMEHKDMSAMDAFHCGADYQRLLKEVLELLIVIGEPGATEKLVWVHDEIATMGPAVFLTPWELTLADLDKRYESIVDVEFTECRIY